MTDPAPPPDPPVTDEMAAEAAAAQAAIQFVGTFDDFALPEVFNVGLRDLGYKQPTIVQAAVFKAVREGKDVLVQSRTGSGKTTAFALPLLAGIDASKRRPQALVLAPTRELALQVSAETARLGHHAGIRVVTIYGGASMRAQIDALQAGAHFVVGTPGRVKDLYRQGYLRFEHIKAAVLDEADEMLSRGFWDEVTSILDTLPTARQTALFSATLPPAIERAASKYLKTPARIDLSRDTVNVSTIRHILHNESEKWSKPRNFLYVLEFHRPRSAIVFCNRRDETEMICQYLRRFGFRAEALNGDMPQKARERTLERVKAGELDLMVATDIAARGIDISDLGHVFNYDLPEHDEVYVHRVGRTGRIGKKGVAVSLVRGKYLAHLAALKKQFKVPFDEIVLPDEKEVLWMQAERLAVQILEAAEGVEMEQYRPVAEAMMERGDVKEILAFLLRTHFSANRPAPSRELEADGGGERAPRADRPPRDRGERRPRFDRPRDERPEGAPPVGAEGVEVAAGEPAGEPTVDDASARNLYVTLGREDGVADLTALIAKLAALSGVDAGHFTGHGDVRDHSSHVEVDAEVAEAVVAGVHGKPRGDKTYVPEGATEAVPQTILCEPAKSGPRRGGERGDRGGRGGDRGDRDGRRGGRGRGPRRR
ncbi:MAG: DEAD/DEAH box helicase [Deltaproteobacteria bacterium]|nr:DEAD/DEAH box helicase [Deltaproteobacteria bacterium]